MAPHAIFNSAIHSVSRYTSSPSLECIPFQPLTGPKSLGEELGFGVGPCSLQSGTEPSPRTQSLSKHRNSSSADLRPHRCHPYKLSISLKGERSATSDMKLEASPLKVEGVSL